MNRKPLVFAISLILFTACSPQVKKEVAAEAAATARYDKAKAEREIDQLSVTGSRKRNIVDEEKAQPLRVVTRSGASAEPRLMYFSAPVPSPQPMLDKAMAGNATGLVMQAQPEQNTEKYKNFSDNPIFLTAENPVIHYCSLISASSWLPVSFSAWSIKPMNSAR